MLLAEHRLGHEIAAHETEHVPVTRVAAADPGAGLGRSRTDDGKKVEDEAKDAGPAVRHLEAAADDSGEKVLEGRLDRRRDHFFRSELAGHVDVAEAARRDPSVVELLPVIEAVATVMGASEQALLDRFRRDHLTTGRHDECLEVPEQT